MSTTSLVATNCAENVHTTEQNVIRMCAYILYICTHNVFTCKGYSKTVHVCYLDYCNTIVQNYNDVMILAFNSDHFIIYIRILRVY